MTFSNNIFDIDFEMVPGHNTGVINGTLCNKSDRTFSSVLLDFHYYDREDFRIGQEQIFVNDVAAREKIRFAGSITMFGKETATVRLVNVSLLPPSDYADVRMDDAAVPPNTAG